MHVSALGLAWLLAQPGTTSVLRRTVITGRVAGSEAFARQLSNDLWFCLHPDADNSGLTYGWRIQIGPACDPSAPSFTIVTPPLHGPNATAIDAWHFDPGANAPGRVRDFRFVLKREDYDAILGTLNSDADADTVMTEFDRLGRGQGVLTVIRFARRKNAAGQSVFDWLAFRAELRQR